MPKSALPADLAEIIATHRALFGGFTMLADEASADGQTENPSGPTDPGFPAETPIAEMTDAEQAAYWKHQSRKHEATAKSRADYDDLKSELTQLRDASKTDTEKAIEAARAEGRQQATAESGARIVGAFVSAKLGDKAETVLAGMNPAAPSPPTRG